DPARLADVLNEMRAVGAGVRDVASSPFDPTARDPHIYVLSVRDFAPLVGLSVPGVFALIHARRRHLRIASAERIFAYLAKLYADAARLPAVQVVEDGALGRVGTSALPRLARERGFADEDDLFTALLVAIKV